MRNLVFLGILSLCVAAIPSQAQAPYSLEKIWGLLGKRPTTRLYMFVPGQRASARNGFSSSGSIARIVYLPAEKRMLFDVLPVSLTTSSEQEIREVSPEDPLVKERFKEKFDSALIIVSCGKTFGDEDCDQYSLINQKPLIGKQINAEARRIFSDYLQAIGTVLDRKR